MAAHAVLRITVPLLQLVSSAVAVSIAARYLVHSLEASTKYHRWSQESWRQLGGPGRLCSQRAFCAVVLMFLRVHSRG